MGFVSRPEFCAAPRKKLAGIRVTLTANQCHTASVQMPLGDINWAAILDPVSDTPRRFDALNGTSVSSAPKAARLAWDRAESA